MKKLLVIIVSYNAAAWLDRCLGSVKEASQADVMVLDNCSTDGTPGIIERDYPFVKLVRNQKNLGFGAANNIGLKYALEQGYDYAYLLNQDAWLLPGTLTRLIEAAEASSEFALLSPLQMSADGISFDPNFRKWAVRSNMPSSGIYQVKRVMAAHWLLRLSALKQVGLFAPIFPHYGEDDNLCDRLRYCGYKIGVSVDAKAIHDRALRQEQKATLIRRNYYIKSLVELSNPCKPLWRQWLFVLAYTFVKAIKYCSFEPFAYLAKILGQGSEIRNTRALSRKKH